MEIHNIDLNISTNEEEILGVHLNMGEETLFQGHGENIYLDIDLNKFPNYESNMETEEFQSQHNGENIPSHMNLNSSADELNKDTNHRDFDLNKMPQLHERTEDPKSKNLSNDQRLQIYTALLERSVNGRLRKNTTKLVATLFSVYIGTVRRIWNRAKENNGDVSNHRPNNCGRKRVQIDLNEFRNIPLPQRTSIRSTASALKVSTSSVYRSLKNGAIRRHSDAIKPLLKEENKKDRLRFCLSMIEENSIPHDPEFKDLYNIVYIDEKWFYLTKKSETYYFVSNEEEPHRMCKSKNFVTKVMFFAVIAHPRFDDQGNEVFSGKIRIFLFITKEPARRNSVNRPARTMETKLMTSVGKDTIRSFLINKVLPAIRSKWPREDAVNPIYIQQDNARTYPDPHDPEFCEAAKRYGFDIRLMCQPANSPDLNILDLGFFNAIQSLRYKEAPRTDELIVAVEKAFETFSSVTSNRIFLTLQSCMLKIMETEGSNRYKIPHMNKCGLERYNELPCQLKCDVRLLEDVKRKLS